MKKYTFSTTEVQRDIEMALIIFILNFKITVYLYLYYVIHGIMFIFQDTLIMEIVFCLLGICVRLELGNIYFRVKS